MNQDTTKPKGIEWVSETGKPGGDLLGFDAETGEILYRIVKEEKNCFALWAEPMDARDEPIERFVSAEFAKVRAKKNNDAANRFADDVVNSIKGMIEEQKRLLSAKQSVVVVNNQCDCEADCAPRRETAWGRFRRFITGGRQ